MAKVKGKLKAQCYVDRVLREAGEEVEVPEEIAADFLETPEAPVEKKKKDVPAE